MKFICGIRNPRTKKTCNANFIGLRALLEHYWRVHTDSHRPAKIPVDFLPKPGI